ncbi:unnamed protein product [Blepharisma stoltei]|uniref:Ribosomal protein S7 n=1 Tax=Blepharisma stoltei TaxID=1481888 RepID=A0AAU9IRQ9_9CILI|nr:unnamed protein product [Blepharisma stoltei]
MLIIINQFVENGKSKIKAKKLINFSINCFPILSKILKLRVVFTKNVDKYITKINTSLIISKIKKSTYLLFKHLNQFHKPNKQDNNI